MQRFSFALQLRRLRLLELISISCCETAKSIFSNISLPLTHYTSVKSQTNKCDRHNLQTSAIKPQKFAQTSPTATTNIKELLADNTVG